MTDLNPQHHHYKWCALPIELIQHIIKIFFGISLCWGLTPAIATSTVAILCYTHNTAIPTNQLPCVLIHKNARLLEILKKHLQKLFHLHSPLIIYSPLKGWYEWWDLNSYGIATRTLIWHVYQFHHIRISKFCQLPTTKDRQPTKQRKVIKNEWKEVPPPSLLRQRWIYI